MKTQPAHPEASPHHSLSSWHPAAYKPLNRRAILALSTQLGQVLLLGTKPCPAAPVPPQQAGVQPIASVQAVARQPALPEPAPTPHLDRYTCRRQTFTYLPSVCLSQGPTPSSTDGSSKAGRVVDAKPSSCDSGIPVYIRLYLPASPSTQPSSVLLFSPAFLTASSAYDSLLEAAAAQGLVAATFDVQQSATAALDDVDSTQVLAHVMSWCNQEVMNSVGLQAKAGNAMAASTKFVLAGHSRGAKMSCLLAAQQFGTGSGGMHSTAQHSQPEVVGLVLLDPADGSFETLEGPRYPSAAKALAGLPVPVLVIGATLNKDCIPRKENYLKFWSAARSPAALVELQGAGHFAFLDYQTVLQQSVCSLGKLESGAVRAASQALLLHWVQWCMDGGQQLSEDALDEGLINVLDQRSSLALDAWRVKVNV